MSLWTSPGFLVVNKVAMMLPIDHPTNIAGKALDIPANEKISSTSSAREEIVIADRVDRGDRP